MKALFSELHHYEAFYICFESIFVNSARTDVSP